MTTSNENSTSREGRIRDVVVHVLLAPDADVGATSSAQDDLVVEIHSDDGLVGIGEADVNPWIARECILAPSTHTMGQSLADLIIGQSPLDTDTLWDRMYTGSAMNGRRGAVVHAIGALDIALHDLRAKIQGRPVWAHLGEKVRDRIRPYASLQPQVAGYANYQSALIDEVVTVKRLGFTAAKISLTFDGPYAHMGMRLPHHRMTETLAAVREAVGPEFTIMVDVQYAFENADDCLSTIKDWIDFNPYFVETPLQADDLAGYARVSTEQPIPIAAGEWLATRHEFRDLIERGRIQVAQPDIGRVGGLTEALRVSELARANGISVIPHLWKTGISVAAALHYAAVTPHCEFIEFTPPSLASSPLRRRLLKTEPSIRPDGLLDLPSQPGLGVEIDFNAVDEFARIAAQARSRRG